MAIHVEGANDRAAAAYEHMEPGGWEVYGSPRAESLAQLQAAAVASGAPLTVYPDSLGGFLRATPR